MKLLRSIVFGGAMVVIGIAAIAPAAQATPPANDNIAQAIQLSRSLEIIEGTTTDSTVEGGEPAHPSSSSNTSVWYQWTSPLTGTVLISSCPNQKVTIPAVYTPGLTLVAGTGLCQTKFNVSAGNIYKIAFYASSVINKGDFRAVIRAWSAPANDDFNNARVLTGTYATANGTLGGATTQAGEPSHGGGSGTRTVWYRWTAPANGPTVFNVCAREVTTNLAAYTGSAVNALVPVISSGCSVRFNATSGTTYNVAVATTASDDPGDFTLWAKQFTQPPNDSFSFATSIPAAGGDFDGQTGGATVETGEPDLGMSGGTAWYSWQPGVNGQAYIDICNVQFGLSMIAAVYLGNSVSGLSFQGGASCLFTFPVNSTDTYRIQVAGITQGLFGDYHLKASIANPPANDDLAGAVPLTGSTANQTGTNIGSTTQLSETDVNGNKPGTVWYRWTAPSNAQTTIDLCGSDFDTILGVFTGTAFPLTEISVSDDTGASGCGSKSAVSFSPVAGTEYKLRISGFAKGSLGSYKLRIYPGPLTPPKFTVQVNKTGTGSGTVYDTALGGILCGSACSVAINDGGAVNLIAVADQGSEFVGWRGLPAGSCTSTIRCTYLINQDQPVTAVFTDLLHKTLTVSKDGDGSGTITSSPAGIGCGATCAHAFDTGTVVTLTPAPAAGSTFAGWTGACSGTGACQVTMDDEKNVNATFSALPAPALTLKTGKAKLNRKKGTALLPVTVNAPAKISLTGRNVMKKTVTVKAAKTVKLAVVVKGELKKALKKKRKAVAKLKITATPSSGGKTLVRKIKVTLKLKKKPNRR